ncbi:MAG: S1/P1 nuclease [Planctomycetota bacterium]|nr:S1/P1 nuclease [Planctomycetota bacterium]
MSAFRRLAVLASILALAAPAPARAWGPEGHEIVGWVAQLHLTEKARARVLALLGAGESLASVSNWADFVRLERRETASWHYVDIPLADERYEPEKHGARPCVTEKLKEFAKRLANAELKDEEKLEALKFLIHFAGDLHMPLHCGTRELQIDGKPGTDKGGNLAQVWWKKEGEKSNLHQVWDIHLVRACLGESNAKDYAGALEAQFKDQAAKLAEGDPDAWTTESHGFARERVYQNVPVSERPVLLGDAYFAANKDLVERQLYAAGVRLAKLLNAALGE